MRRPTHLLAVLALASATLTSVSAAPVSVSSYSMNNGATGSFNYRDFSYSSCDEACNVTNAALSGGTGKLTDGYWPWYDWYAYGQDTPWVGWDKAQGQADPLITFSFERAARIDSVSLWLSNTLDGGVALPSAVLIDGHRFDIQADLVNQNIHEVVFSGLDFLGQTHTLQFIHASGSPWVMLGEVSFSGSLVNAVPEPSTIALALLALGAIAATARSKQCKAPKVDTPDRQGDCLGA